MPTRGLAECVGAVCVYTCVDVQRGGRMCGRLTGCLGGFISLSYGQKRWK